jgi:O-methyltransferase involved in polyketide biosynthesis
VRWHCVDVPEAIEVRERFLPSTERCRYIAKSALDLSWLDGVEASPDVFVSAQGLFMYFDEADIKRLFVAMVDRFPGVTVLFDIIPRAFSRRTLRGFGRTQHYHMPPMPWGIGRDELGPLLKRWSPRVRAVTTRPYGFCRGPGRALISISTYVPFLRNSVPAIAHVTTCREPHA